MITGKRSERPKLETLPNGCALEFGQFHPDSPKDELAAYSFVKFKEGQVRQSMEEPRITS